MASPPGRSGDGSTFTDTNVIHLVHAAVRGRTRLHVPIIYRNQRGAAALERRLRDQPWVRGFRTNVHTGNVLVLFDPNHSADDILDLIAGLTAGLARGAPPRSAAVTRRTAVVSAGGASHPTVAPSLAWHTLPSDLVIQHLDTAIGGLSTGEAYVRLLRYGRNELQVAAARPLGDIIIAQVKSVPTLLLIGSAALSVLTGGFMDAAVIAAVVVINAAIGAYTEAAAERTMLALTRFTAPPVAAGRDGARVAIDLADLVPGDVIHVTRGDYVSADARLIDTTDLSVAESALTGESAPVSKDAGAIVDACAPLGDRFNMVYRGTVVTGGSGVAVVVATGSRTEIGRIQELIAEAAQPETPLQRQLRTLGQQLAIATCGVSACMVLIGLSRGYGLVEIVRVAISLAVAAIPEGLPTVATMTLATGVRRMRKQGLLVRRLDAVETLGAVQVICLDKTGTITANRMVVHGAYVDGRRLRVDRQRILGDIDGTPIGTDDALVRLLHVGALCSDATVEVDASGERRVDGTPTETALVHFAIDRGLDVNALRRMYPLRSRLARAERRMYMTTVHATPDGRRLVAMKGRPDQVVSRCGSIVHDGTVRDLTAADHSDIESANEQMAGQGLRVLAFAFAEVDADDLTDDTPLVWAGLAGIADPPRPGIKAVVDAFHAAGIQTVMITGDQSATACAVARTVGLRPGSELQVLDSTGLAGIPDDILSALAARVNVFSRVSPSNKLQIVRALQQAGLVVAMTGDGVNDGPALKASNVGIAMGRGGAELAREVADIVLLEDDVGALVDAIVEGRTAADDIRKSVHFIVATNLSEVMLTVGATALGFGVPLTATQLLWINLLTDVFPELALAIDPSESDVLTRPPRAANAQLVSARDCAHLGLDGTFMTGAAMGSYLYGLGRYGPTGAGTMAFLTLTSAQLLHVFRSHADTHALYKRGRTTNPWIGLSVVGGFLVQGLAGAVPPLRRLLGTTPVTVGDAVLSWGLAALSFVARETVRLLTPASRAHGSVERRVP